jgi:hypothetical protein
VEEGSAMTIRPRAADDFEVIRERLKELKKDYLIDGVVQHAPVKEMPVKFLCTLCGTDGSTCTGACCD